MHPNNAGTQADSEIVMIRREPGDTRIVGEEWHTDTTIMAEPPMEHDAQPFRRVMRRM